MRCNQLIFGLFSYKRVFFGVIITLVVVNLLAFKINSKGYVEGEEKPNFFSVQKSTFKRNLLQSPSYTIQSDFSCWNIECDRKPSNFRAYAPCFVEDATDWNNFGVKAMERYIEGDIVGLPEYNSKYLEDAFWAFGNATELDPKCESAHSNLALVYMEMGNKDSALTYIEKAIQINPKNANSYAIRVFIQELQNSRFKDKDFAKLSESEKLIIDHRYFGIISPQNYGERNGKITAYSEANELPFAQKMLIFLEFSPISVSDYALVLNEQTKHFVKNKWVVLRKVIHPFLLKPLSKCYSMNIKKKKFRLNDPQSKRWIASNDRCTRIVQYQLVDLVRRVILHDALPSYTYFGGYYNGSYLNPHTDRYQCEFTISLTIEQHPWNESWPLGLHRIPQFEYDNSRDGADQLPWPPEDEQEYVSLYAGDCLLFMGRHLIHFRKGHFIGADRFLNQAFLHYVQEDFSRSLM